VLEDGASFKGLVDMGERPEAKGANAKAKSVGGSARPSDADSGKANAESSSSGGSSTSARPSSGKDAEGSEVMDKAVP
jgi:hypothetical protein